MLTGVAEAGEEEDEDDETDEDFVPEASCDEDDDDGQLNLPVLARDEGNWAPIPGESDRYTRGIMTVTHRGPSTRYVFWVRAYVDWEFSCQHDPADGALSEETATQCELMLEQGEVSAADCTLTVVTPQRCAAGHA